MRSSKKTDGGNKKLEGEITQEQKSALLMHLAAAMVKKAIEGSRDGISREQEIVLLAIDFLVKRGVSVTTRKLAWTLGYSEHSVYTMIIRLERAKLVKRVPSKKNKRWTSIVLTPKGNDVLKRMQSQSQEELLGNLFSGVDTKAFSEVLSLIYRNASKIVSGR